MQIYRKRFDPEECVLLKDDEIVYHDSSYIFTKWKTLKPRDDFDNGASIYDISNGVKVSKFCKEDKILYYYIDIIDIVYNQDEDTYLCTDYVLDVILEPDFSEYRVLDEDEFEELIEKGTFTHKEISESYNKLEFMKKCIEEKRFNFYLKLFNTIGL